MRLRAPLRPYLLALVSLAIFLLAATASARETRVPGREGTIGIGSLRIGLGRLTKTVNATPGGGTRTGTFKGFGWMPKPKGSAARGFAWGKSNIVHRSPRADGAVVVIDDTRTVHGRSSTYQWKQSVEQGGATTFSSTANGKAHAGRGFLYDQSTQTEGGQPSKSVRSLTKFDKSGNAVSQVTQTTPHGATESTIETYDYATGHFTPQTVPSHQIVVRDPSKK